MSHSNPVSPPPPRGPARRSWICCGGLRFATWAAARCTRDLDVIKSTRMRRAPVPFLGLFFLWWFPGFPSTIQPKGVLSFHGHGTGGKLFNSSLVTGLDTRLDSVVAQFGQQARMLALGCAKFQPTQANFGSNVPLPATLPGASPCCRRVSEELGTRSFSKRDK